MKHRDFCADNFRIVDKQKQVVPFQYNMIQQRAYNELTHKDIFLKARQMGFSMLFCGIFAIDFLVVKNSYSVVLADRKENATGMLDRVSYMLKSYEDINTDRLGKTVRIPYDRKALSKGELKNEVIGSTLIIGTATEVDIGRSRTINNLLCTEVAFYPNIRKILSGAVQAVVPDGRVIFETTANGFNEFRKFYYDSKSGLTGFKTHFFKASDAYNKDFLAQRRQEIPDTFQQEYPETEAEAFIASGRPYFNMDALQRMLSQTKRPMTGGELVYS